MPKWSGNCLYEGVHKCRVIKGKLSYYRLRGWKLMGKNCVKSQFWSQLWSYRNKIGNSQRTSFDSRFCLLPDCFTRFIHKTNLQQSSLFYEMEKKYHRKFLINFCTREIFGFFIEHKLISVNNVDFTFFEDDFLPKLTWENLKLRTNEDKQCFNKKIMCSNVEMFTIYKRTKPTNFKYLSSL